MLSETQNELSLTRAASSTCACVRKQSPISYENRLHGKHR